MRKQISTKRIKAALIKANGLPTIAAKLAGCCYNTVNQRCKDEPELEALRIELEASNVQKSVQTLITAQDCKDKDGNLLPLAVTAATNFLKIHPAAKAAGFGE